MKLLWRAYERLALPGRTVLLMNAPRRPDGPPIRYGKSYSTIAHLAEDVRAFVAVAEALRTLGFSAPAVHAADLAQAREFVEVLVDEQFRHGVSCAVTTAALLR